MNSFSEMLTKLGERREQDAKRWHDMDNDLCMLCHAYGPDMRSLFINCLYSIEEIVPEIIDLFKIEQFKDRGYYIRICKSCRGSLLGKMRDWRNERVALRSFSKDSDGEPYDEEANIPVRISGATIMMTLDQYNEWKGGIR